MNIKVLGTGCPKCKKLFSEVEKALSASGIEAELEKVEQIDEIMKYKIMMTPALVIDGEVKSVGKIPKSTQIIKWITAQC
jgi:small redox-active disulfide protein 2